MPDYYRITTDYSTDAQWELRDADRNSVKIAAVGTLAQIGSNMGYQVRIQKNAMEQLIDEVEAVRDAMRSIANQGFPELTIENTSVRPPEALEVVDLLPKPMTSLGLADVNRLADLATWIDATFSTWVGDRSPLLAFPDVKVTYRTAGATENSWMVLKNIYPLPVVPLEGILRSDTGSVVLNKPFSVEGDAAVYMMVAGSGGTPEKVKINVIDKLFSSEQSVHTYDSYFRQLAMARSDAIVKMIPDNAVSTAPYDTIAYTLDAQTFLSPLPIVETTTVIPTGTTTFTAIQAAAGALIRSPVSAGSQEFLYFLAKVANPSKRADLVPVEVDLDKRYILSLSDDERQTVTSQFGDKVVTLTQRSSQQSVYLNELMQKMALFHDAASNALKAMTDNENRIAAGI